MSQDELWFNKYQEMVAFIEKNKRNPSKYSDEERGKYLNWLKHNKKLFAAGLVKDDRVALFESLLVMCEKYKRVNQWK